MYRIVTSLIIIIFIARLIWISRSRDWGFDWWKRNIDQNLTKLFKRMMMSGSEGNIYKRLRYFFVSISFLTFFILAISGIIPVVILNKHISGVFLIIHVTIAPVFVVALAMTAFFWAHFKQFNLSDFQFINNLRDKNHTNHQSYYQHPFLLKVYFWVFLAFSVPAALSMIFSMFPFFGTEGQIALFNIHQYTALGLLIVAFFYVDFKLLFADLKSKNE
jgi:hypothetical protein